MNAERLLAHYHRIADAPDAVAKLRRLVLDLAVRGRLVAQDRDEAQPQEPDPRVEPVEQPFSIPPNWIAVRLEEVADCLDYLRRPINAAERARRVAGKTPGQLYPYYGATQQQGWIDSFLFDEELVLLGEDGVPFFDELRTKAYLISGRSWVNNHAHVLRGVRISNKYLVHYLNAFDYSGRVAGATRSKLNQSRALDIPVMLPPAAEQHRIVAKVEELMVLCDQLEAARAKREATRDRLTTATLARLNSTEPATLASGARFVLDALTPLTDRYDQIQQARQAVLNLAVRGKLVPQSPDDEPVAQMLRRVGELPSPARYEKRSPELIPGDCGLSINDPGTPLPSGWQWVPLTKIARLESGHTPSRSRPEWWGGDVPWMGLVDARVHNNGVIHETIQTTNQQGLANSAARLLPAGTVCFSRTASVGYVVIMGRPMATSQDFVNWVPSDAVSSRWLQLVLIAERPAIGRFSKGAVHQTIYYPAWLSMHIALPPLSEQSRIVERVDELMALCDHLEANLVRRDEARRQLLEALLHEALEAEPGEAA